MIVRMIKKTYAVEQNGDVPVGVNGGLVAAQLRDFADDGDGAADEAVEEGGGDAGGGHLLGHGWCFGGSWMLCLWLCLWLWLCLCLCAC